MTEITLTYGLPGSGKTLWAEDRVDYSQGKIVRINMDDIRAMIGLPYSEEAEELALQIQDQAILSAVAAGKNVIVDNTHITEKMPKRIKNLFDGEITFKVQSFADRSMRSCIDGDNWRKKTGLRYVGEDVIRQMQSKMQGWKLTEEYMNSYRFPLRPLLDYSDSDLPICAVFDLDGTLFNNKQRHPHDYSKVDTDTLFEHVAQKVKFYWDNHYSVFFVSGRPHVWKDLDIRKMTEERLRHYHINYDHLFMRDGITQKDWNDADVKHHIVNTELRGQYYIEAWHDDRNRVVRRLRKLNINVSQESEGNF